MTPSDPKSTMSKLKVRIESPIKMVVNVVLEHCGFFLPQVTFTSCSVIRESLVLLCAGLHAPLTLFICLHAKMFKATITQVVHSKVRGLIPDSFLFLVLLDFENKWKCPIIVLHVHISTPILLQLVSNHSQIICSQM